MKISKDMVATIEYTLTDEKGEIIDSSEGNEPLAYLHGAKNIIPGLESQLEGKKAGDKLEVTVQPKDGYGEINETLVSVINSSQFQGVPELKEGMQFTAKTEQGEYVVTVTKIDGDQVTIDANHALAGVTLNFAVEVVGVREATAEELRHKHVHHAGGHAH